MAPWVEDWHGLSLTRFIAGGTFMATVELAHDWIAWAKEQNQTLGWAFATFILSGFLLAVMAAIGQKAVLPFVLTVAEVLGAWLGKKLGGSKPAPEAG